MATPKVNSVQNDTSKSVQVKRQAAITVKSGENLTVIAKRYDMSPKEFMEWTGLKKTTVNAGQKINIPHDTVPAGKGILALARKYGMTLDEFCKLNNIPKTYSPAKGEFFYVKNHNKANTPATENVKPKQSQKPDTSKTQSKPKTTTKSQTKPKQKTDKGSEPATGAVAGATVGAVVGAVVSNKAKWGSVYTPQELATKIYECSKKFAAVGKPDFDALINEINPKNVEEVLEKYTKKESLIKTITSEVMSDKQKREDAVMKVYDALAKAKGTLSDKRVEFQQELHHQLHKLVGMADTTKLDKMINEMLKAQTVKDSSIVSKSRNYEGIAKERARKTTLGNGKVATAGDLRSGAIAGAKRDEGFKKVKNPYIVRPLPNINSDGKIEAASEIRQPTNNSSNAPLKGKVVIVNAGHGGYNPSNGYFDSGTVLSVKNADGKEMPIEEWRVAGSYTEELTKKLQAKGATVVVVSGPVKKGTGGMYETQYLENLLKGNRGSQEVRDLFKNTKKSDMAFISIHVESMKQNPSDKACTVRANRDSGDQAFAEKIQKHVGSNIYGLKPEVKTNDYYVTRAMGAEIPAVLVELGNIANEKIAASLLSSNDRDKYTTALSTALEETLLKK